MATNRLRKRVEEGGGEQALSKGMENFCMIGTPLPRLDGKKDVNEYKPVWEQEVLDEQGRRRFHGAFTGGYSAGYFNTVGSKEGWAPSTFRSSRKDKSGKGQGGGDGALGSRPEDFMDEEDLESLREGRGALSSTQTYEMEQQQQQQGRDPLMDILGLGQSRAATNAATSLEASMTVQVASMSLGTRLLQRMGWRQGQGLGPRVSFKRRNEMIALLGGSSKTKEEDEEAGKHLWPPPDTPMPSFSARQNAKGLGWSGESRGVGLDEALRRAREEKDSKSRVTERRSGGFGLGALEDDSDGEEEIYTSGNRMEDSTLARKGPAKGWAGSHDRMVLGGSPEDDKLKAGGQTRPTKQGEGGDSDNVWHDGRAMLVGFKIASRTTEREPWFETAAVPSGWKADPHQVWSRAGAEKSKPDASNRLRAADRASILGEARLPGPPPSIQDYLSVKDRERLQRAKEATATPKKEGALPPALVKSDTVQSIPVLDAAVARAALQGYKPFSNEPEKQERYIAYLSSQAHPQLTTTSSLRPSGQQTQTQFTNELREFAKSAGIFKPMSTVMANRFQSSVSGSNDIPQTNPGLHIPEPKPTLSVEEAKTRAEEKKRMEEEEKRKEEMELQTSAQRNASLGLFGRDTTRETLVWKPSRLLCKRFNVPMPYPEEEGSREGEEGNGEREGENGREGEERSRAKKGTVPNVNAKWEASKRQLQQLAAQRSWEGEERVQRENQDGEEVQEGGNGAAKGALDVNNIGLGEVGEEEEEGRVEKAPMDVFKAVFADDDEDDDEDDEEEEERAEGKIGKGSVKDEGKIEKGRAGESTADEEKTADAQAAPESTSFDSFRPTFVPRKRRAEEGSSKGSSGDKQQQKKKKDSRKGKGLLTFSVDEEVGDGEDEGSGMAAKKASRPRAADLFG